jgi:amino acid adenylation domain-containing protein
MDEYHKNADNRRETMENEANDNHRTLRRIQIQAPIDCYSDATRQSPLSDKSSKLSFSTYVLASWLIQFARYSDSSSVTIKSQNPDGSSEWLSHVITIDPNTRADAWLESLEIHDLLPKQGNPVKSFDALPPFDLATDSSDIYCILNSPINEIGIERVQQEWIHSNPALSLQLVSDGDGLKYISDISQQAHFGAILLTLLTSEDIKIGDVDCLSDHERRKVLIEWNQTERDYPLDKCFHQLFTKQVNLTPNQVAIRFNNESITYQQLEQLSNQFARYLLDQNLGPNNVIGLFLKRSPLWPIGMLAIWKVGAVFLPLEAELPNERLNYILNDSRCDLIVTQQELIERFEASKTPVIKVDLELLKTLAPLEEDQKTSPNSLAYVIYTSGTTGMPKGVKVNHKGLSNLAYCQYERMSFKPNQSILQAVSFNFDASLHDVTFAFLSGSALCIADENSRLPGPSMVDFLRREKINFLTLPPSALETLPIDELPDLHTILAVGEVCNASLVRRWAGKVKFFNGYGPTETTVGALIGECFPEEDKPTIGTPLANVQIYILDSRMQPVPIGVIGEIYVGGVGVATGYLNQTTKTQQSFVTNPFSKLEGDKLYKTGDKARYLNDGRVDFIGRIDGQVKISGKRIEVEEIESRSKAFGPISSAAVIIHESGKNKRHIRLVVSLNENFESAKPQAIGRELKRYLASYLPSYMLPSQILILNEMPMTINGKLDKARLANLADYYVQQSRAITEKMAIDNMAIVCKSIGENTFIPICYYAAANKEVLQEDVRKIVTSELSSFAIPVSYFPMGSFSPIEKESDIETLPVPSLFQTKWSQLKAKPSTPTEKILERTWLKHMDISEVFLGDQFVDKGGDSLAAVKIISDILNETNQELTGGDFYGGDFSYCAARLESKISGKPMANQPSRSSFIPEKIEAFFFDKLNRGLFGIFHPSLSINKEKTAVLICPPFSNDYQRSRPLMQQLASHLSSSGFPTMRFDYSGCGDSFGDSSELDLETCRQNILSAIKELSQRTNASSISIIGIRLSATILTNTELAGSVKQLILVDPVTSGCEYIKTKRALQSAILNDPNHFQWRRKIRRNSNYEELLGQGLSHQFLTEIENLKMKTPIAQLNNAQSSNSNGYCKQRMIISSAEGISGDKQSSSTPPTIYLNQDCQWNSPDKIDSTILQRDLFSAVQRCLGEDDL